MRHRRAYGLALMLRYAGPRAPERDLGLQRWHRTQARR